MRRIIDLSHPITEDIPVFPGDPTVRTNIIHSIKDGGYNVSEICMSLHTGTHVDVAHHVMYTDHGVDKLPLDALVGWAEVLDLGDIPAQTEITAADLDAFADRVDEGARLLLKTDWSKKMGQPDFFTDFPGLTEGAARWLIARNVKLVAIEQPSVHPTDHINVHKSLLSHGIVLIESIANLDRLTSKRVYIAALPPNLVGMDGAPIRVIAIEGIEVLE